MAITALVLRNYGCSASNIAGVAIALALCQPRYGNVIVDPNDSDDFPDGKDENGVDRWYPYVQDLILSVDYLIVMLSRALNDSGSDGARGAGLISEVLSFWSKQDLAKEKKLIFVTVDCNLADLCQSNGHFEQLQDIIVPMARRLGVTRVDTQSLSILTPVPVHIADAIARCMGIEPPIGGSA